MAKATAKLGAILDIEALGPGRHSDGAGLYLVIDRDKAGKPTSPRWSLRVYQQGKVVDKGLGRAGADGLSPARARLEAARLRALKDEGEHISTKGQRAPLPDDPARITFGAFADSFVDDIAPGFRNPKHRAQWRTTVEKTAAAIRSKPIDDVKVDDILDVLRPHWFRTPNSADRARGRLERIFQAATIRGLYSRLNPALRPSVVLLLPKRGRNEVVHHQAMPYRECSAFFVRLATARVRGVSNEALKFLMLTVCRSGEVRGARWSEISSDGTEWLIPAERMKAGKLHIVPLTPAVRRILDNMRHYKQDADSLIFPGAKKNTMLSDMALLQVMRRLGSAYVPHGFRSSFRDWCFETKPDVPREVAEMALAHVVGSAVERAYRRSTGLEQRRLLLEEWSLFIDDPFQ